MQHSAKRLTPFGIVGKPATYSSTAGDLSIENDCRIQGTQLLFDANADHSIFGGTTSGNDLFLYANSSDSYPYIQLEGNNDVLVRLPSITDRFNITGGGTTFSIVPHNTATTIYGGASSGQQLNLYSNSNQLESGILLYGGGQIEAYVAAGSNFDIVENVFGTILSVNKGQILYNTTATTGQAININANTVTTGEAQRITFDGSVMTAAGRVFNLYDSNATASVFSIDEIGDIWLPNSTHNIHIPASGTFTIYDATAGSVFDFRDSGCQCRTDLTVEDNLTTGSTATYGGGTVTEHTDTQTIGATTPNIATTTLQDNSAYLIKAKVIGMESDGSDRNVYHFEGLFYRDGGNATQQGVTTVITEIESEAAADCDFNLSGSDVRIQVTGVAAETWNWHCELEYTAVY